VEQLEDVYVRFIARSFFCLVVKFYAHLWRHVKVSANDKSGTFETHARCSYLQLELFLYDFINNKNNVKSFYVYCSQYW